MSSVSRSSRATRRASIKELLQVRTQIAEKLAGQLERYDTANDAVTEAQRAAAAEAASARTVYEEAIDAGWTASELASAGLRPPAPPRKRATVTRSTATVDGA